MKNKNILSRLMNFLLKVVFVFALILSIYAIRQIWSITREDEKAKIEYKELRGLDLDYLSSVNPNFIGWINIPGTLVDYPVVRSTDNERYLQRTFRGLNNLAGAIFMDYRASHGFFTPITILYGHNMRNGTMFASLLQYLDDYFLNHYPKIEITTIDGEILLYHIFNIRLSHAQDPIYSFDFNDEETISDLFNDSFETNNFLILSTCADNSDRDSRLLVYAKLITD